MYRLVLTFRSVRPLDHSDRLQLVTSVFMIVMALSAFVPVSVSTLCPLLSVLALVRLDYISLFCWNLALASFQCLVLALCCNGDSESGCIASKLQATQ